VPAAFIVLVSDLERRTAFGPCLPVIVDPRRGDIRMPKPLLHLGYVRLVIEGIRRRRRTQRMCPDLNAKRR
jgi:hypothetical protein